MSYRDDHLDHVDEGTIHAWLDEALPPDESHAIEAHVAACESCAASVAEARGLMAAASRVLSALDDIPAGVIPGSRDESGTPRDQLALLRARHASEKTAARRRWWRNGQLVAAASVAFVALGTATVFWRGSFRADALPGAPAAKMEAERSVASDAAAPTPSASIPVPAPMPVSGAGAAASGAAPAEAGKKVAPASSDTAESERAARTTSARENDAAQQRAVVESRDEARERQAEAVRQTPPLPAPQAPPLQGLQRQSGVGQQMTTGARQEVQQQAQRTQDAAKVGETQTAAAEAARLAPPAVQRADSSAAANRRAVAALAFTAGSCYGLSVAGGDVRSSGLPTLVRLDTTRVRAAGDTTWYRAASLPGDAGVELEWRLLGATALELAPMSAGARRVTRVELASGAAQVLAFRDVAPTRAAAAPANEARVVRAVWVDCPR